MSQEPPPDRPPAGAAPLDDGEAVQRVDALMEPDDILHGISFFGEDEKYWYYIAVFEREYQGNEYLNERYAQLVKPEFAEEREDTFKKNGISRRVTDRVKEAATTLTFFYEVAAKREAALRASIEGDIEEEVDPENYNVLVVDVTENPELDDEAEETED